MSTSREMASASTEESRVTKNCESRSFNCVDMLEIIKVIKGKVNGICHLEVSVI